MWCLRLALLWTVAKVEAAHPKADATENPKHHGLHLDESFGRHQGHSHVHGHLRKLLAEAHLENHDHLHYLQSSKLRSLLDKKAASTGALTANAAQFQAPAKAASVSAAATNTPKQLTAKAARAEARALKTKGDAAAAVALPRKRSPAEIIMPDMSAKRGGDDEVRQWQAEPDLKKDGGHTINRDAIAKLAARRAQLKAEAKLHARCAENARRARTEAAKARATLRRLHLSGHRKLAAHRQPSRAPACKLRSSSQDKLVPLMLRRMHREGTRCLKPTKPAQIVVLKAQRSTRKHRSHQLLIHKGSSALAAATLHGRNASVLAATGATLALVQGLCSTIGNAIVSVVRWAWNWAKATWDLFATYVTAAVREALASVNAALTAALAASLTAAQTATRPLTATRPMCSATVCTDMSLTVADWTMDATLVKPEKKDGVGLPVLSLEAASMHQPIETSAKAVADTMTAVLTGGIAAVSSFAGSALLTLSSFCEFAGQFLQVFFARSEEERQVALCNLAVSGISFLVNLVSTAVGVVITVGSGGTGFLVASVAAMAAKGALLAGAAALKAETALGNCDSIRDIMAQDTATSDAAVAQKLGERSSFRARTMETFLRCQIYGTNPGGMTPPPEEGDCKECKEKLAASFDRAVSDLPEKSLKRFIASFYTFNIEDEKQFELKKDYVQGIRRALPSRIDATCGPLFGTVRLR